MMGCSSNLACVTCKIDYYLGYSSYRSIINANSIEEYREVSDGDDRSEYLVNMNREKVLTEHDGHELIDHNEDFTYVDKNSGHMMLERGYEADTIYIKDYATYKKVNMWDQKESEPNVSS